MSRQGKNRLYSYNKNSRYTKKGATKKWIFLIPDVNLITVRSKFGVGFVYSTGPNIFQRYISSTLKFLPG